MSDTGGPTDPTRAGGCRPGRCPICGKPAVERYRPFCSGRCADIDLGRWLGERYRVAGEEATDAESPDPGEDGTPAKPSRS
jgi:endogenous inhibitor of DNA gyrase (YacG/DUF329 family)